MCDVVYSLQVDYQQAIELAEISAGAEVTLGQRVDQFDEWLESEPEVIDRDKAKLLNALGVGP